MNADVQMCEYVCQASRQHAPPVTTNDVSENTAVRTPGIICTKNVIGSYAVVVYDGPMSHSTNTTGGSESSRQMHARGNRKSGGGVRMRKW